MIITTEHLSFVNPKNDIAFRKIFGDQNHSDILLEFLNEVLDLETPILDVKILDPFQLPITKGLKLTTLDVRARDKNHEFLIEMQVEKEKWFAQRVTYYVSKAYARQLKKGQNYGGLKPVIFLGVLDFREFDGNYVFTRHRHINNQTGRNDLKQIELNFIELPNFTKTESELSSLTDQWLYFLKNAESLNHIPNSVTSERLRGAYETLNEHNWLPEELEAYDCAAIKEQARENSIITARLEGEAIGERRGLVQGEEIGEKRGFAKGEAKVKSEMVLAMLENNLDETLIRQCTGLSAQEIAKLKSNYSDR